MFSIGNGHVGILGNYEIGRHSKATNRAIRRCNGMMYLTPSLKRDADGKQVVQRPRVTDTIGLALRGAFGEHPSLTGEMARLLRQIDEATHSIH
jgi:hypothetical protein